MPAQPIELEAVRSSLEQQVRTRAEAVLMEGEARALLERADVVPLTQALKDGWSRQRTRLTQAPN